jgi:hypothetical protein
VATTLEKENAAIWAKLKKSFAKNAQARPAQPRSAPSICRRSAKDAIRTTARNATVQSIDHVKLMRRNGPIISNASWRISATKRTKSTLKII